MSLILQQQNKDFQTSLKKKITSKIIPQLADIINEYFSPTKNELYTIKLKTIYSPETAKMKYYSVTDINNNQFLLSLNGLITNIYTNSTVAISIDDDNKTIIKNIEKQLKQSILAPLTSSINMLKNGTTILRLKILNPKILKNAEINTIQYYLLIRIRSIVQYSNNLKIIANKHIFILEHIIPLYRHTTKPLKIF